MIYVRQTLGVRAVPVHTGYGCRTSATGTRYRTVSPQALAKKNIRFGSILCGIGRCSITCFRGPSQSVAYSTSPLLLSFSSKPTTHLHSELSGSEISIRRASPKKENRYNLIVRCSKNLVAKKKKSVTDSQFLCPVVAPSCL